MLTIYYYIIDSEIARKGGLTMAQMSITAKIQVVASDEDKTLLDETMSVYREACNYVSDYVFRTHDLKQFSLNKALYPTLRAEFGLKSQMTQSVFKTVIARYKTILENQKEWIKPSFKKPQYDLVWNRDYSLTQDRFSINTLGGRVKLPYFAEGMSKYFDRSIYRFGTAKLVNKHGKYFLHIPVTYAVLYLYKIHSSIRDGRFEQSGSRKEDELNEEVCFHHAGAGYVHESGGLRR